MPIIKNPFRKQDENVSPATGSLPRSNISSSPLVIKQPTEYKLSEISTTGEFLPPSPPEKKTFWSSRSNGSTTPSSIRPSILNENEPFSISRESFDSYRRSFDISARSPVIPPAPSRTSLDSRLVVTSRPSYTSTRPEPTTEEEVFEDVGLNAEDKKPKKRGFLSHFGDSQNDASDKPSSGHGFHFGGRKRGQSGQGAELGDIKQAKPT